MKNLTLPFIIILLMLTSSVFSQNPTGSNPYFQDYPTGLATDRDVPWFYYSSPGKIPLEFHQKLALVKFTEDFSFENQVSLLQGFRGIEPLKEEMLLLSPQATIIHFAEGLTEAAISKLLADLSSHPSVVYANPIFKYQEGQFLGAQDELFVGLKEGNLEQLEQLAEQYGAEVLGPYRYSPWIYRLKVKKGYPNALELANLLHESGHFKFAEPDFLYYGSYHFNTNDPYVGVQWALNNTGQVNSGLPGADMSVYNAWDITTGSQDVKVAIIDSGVDLGHPDLVGNLLPGFDATGSGSSGGPLTGGHPDNAHGTACAGIVAASGDNSAGIAGVANGCKMIPIRHWYIDSNGNATGTLSNIVDALNWAWDVGGADIVSNSWGTAPSTLIEDAINNGTTQGRGGLGTIYLFAAGNSNTAVAFPASFWQNVAIGATSMCDERKSPASCDGVTNWGSNYGIGLDLAAPGVLIMTTDQTGNDGYNPGVAFPPDIDYTGYFGGTSAACPNAAGVLALILSVNPNLNIWDARGVLEASCDKVGPHTYLNGVSGQPAGSWTDELGHGRVNAYRAVLLAGGNQGVQCNTYASTNVPINILDNTTVTSTLNVPVSGSIVDINVKNLNGTHTYMGDLSFALTSPENTSVILWQNGCGSQDNFSITLDNEANTLISCPLNLGNTQRPFGYLSSFVGEDPSGNWTVSINDNATFDQGVLQGWSLEVCYLPDPTNCLNNLEVNGNIASGTYHATINLSSNGTVLNGSEVVFKAGTDVDLQDDFEVGLGGTLEVLIEPCVSLQEPNSDSGQ